MPNKESGCDMCGKCCHYEIPVTLLDIHRIAKHLKTTDREAFEEYIDNSISPNSGLFKIQKQPNRACVFLGEANHCLIHEVKPRACRLYICKSDINDDVMPWTAVCTDPERRAELWEQSVAAMMTKAYTKENCALWNDADYHKAIVGIYDNVVISDSQKIKLARDNNGTPISMIYDCNQCERQGACARETPVTLDDLRRIKRYLRVGWNALFREKLASEASSDTGGLKLARTDHCVFFDSVNHCKVEKVRPMHCRFTPCPQRTQNDSLMDCLFLGSGTVTQQFRHQVALAMTRQYVAECGIRYQKSALRRYLHEIDRLASKRTEVEKFCDKIAPYRYVDDTLTLTSDYQQ